MTDFHEADREQAFCEELVRRGWATEAQLGEARRLKAAAEELGQPKTLDGILVMKGYVTADRASTARREVASRLGQTIRIGKYEILQRLGEGGAGIVYRAYQTTLGREVALKVLSRKREGEEEYLGRFLREAKVAVTLNHVNIVRGLDFGNADGYHFFAMELVEGESFLSLIRREGRLPEKKAIDIVLQMVRALEHASKYRIVHRDIKPENILVTHSGTAKLCDLGLARPSIEGGVADDQGRPMGTALYVAPEQIRREPTLDFRADVYSLGATLFHALTGSAPYNGATITEIVRGHLSGPVPNPRDRVLDISTGTASVVMKMLAKDPADRYQTLEMLDEDLDSVLEGRPPVNTITIGRRAAPMGEPVPARGAPERKAPRKVLVPAVVVASLAAIAAGAWYGFGREKPAAPPVVPVAVDPVPKKDTGLDARRMQEARENAAAAAKAEADAFEKERGADAPETAARFREVAAAHPDTSAGRVARQRAADLEKAREARVAAALKDRTAAFNAAFADGRLGEALAAWDGLPPEVEAGGGKSAAEFARTRVEEAGRRLLEAAKTLAAKAAAGDDASVEPARKAIAAAEACGHAPVREAAARELESLEAVVRGRAEALRSAEEAWARVCAEALSAAARGPLEGIAVVDANAALLAPLGGRVEDLRQAIGEGAAFAESVRGGFARAAAAGETVKLRVAGRPGGSVAGRAAGVRAEGFEIQRGPAVEVVAAGEIHPEDLAMLAWKALGAGSAKDHRGAAAFFLSRGAFGPAEGEVRILEVMGAKEDAARTRALVDSTRGAARERAEAALREAEVLRLQKRVPEAKAAYEKAVSLCEGFAPALWKQGAFLLETSRDAGEALKALEAAASLEPAEPEAWYWIAEARRRGGRVDEALAAFDRYLATAPAEDPRREPARKALEELRAAAAAVSAKAAREDAARAFRKDDFAAAEELWRKVLRWTPDDTEAMYFLGKSLLALDRKVEGYSWLRRYLNAERRSGARVDDARKTVKDLEQRLGDSPAAARKSLEGSGLVDQGKYAQAIEILTATVDLAPLRADTYAERARALQFAWATESRRDFLNQAVQDLETALLINEKHGRAWSLLAVTRFNLEEWEKSVEASARAIQLDPQYGAAWEYRARACCKTGKFTEAEHAANEGIARAPNAVLLIVRAEARAGLGRAEEAQRDLDAAAGNYDLTPYEKEYRAEVLGKIRRAGKGGE